MATNWSVCGICDFRKITKTSVVWCSECDEGLCEDCKEHHSVSKASRNHDTVSIDKYQKLPSDILQTVQSCVEHNEKYHIYCQKHDCPCCKICIVEKHSKCKDLKDINDVIKNVKSSVGFIELENTLSEVAENIRRIRKDREENLSSLTKDKKRILQDIKQCRAAVDKHFDNLQEQAIKELQTAAEAESKKIQNILSMVEQQEKIIKECLSNLSSIKEYASDLQTFLAMKQIEIDVKDNVKSIQSFSKSNDLKKTTIFFTADSTIKDLSNRFQNIGEIVIETNPTGISFVRRKEKQAQVMISLQTKSIDSLRLTLEQTVKTNRQSVTGCVYLPSGKMVFSSYIFGKNGGLFILNSNGSKDFQIKPHAAPFDVVYNEKDHTLIATTAFKHMIHVDIENKKTKDIVNLQTECSGLDIAEGNLVYCSGKQGLRQMNVNDDSGITIISEEQDSKSYVALFGKNLYYVNKIKHILTCCDLESTTPHWTFQYMNIIQDPNGISVDDDGNVYVVDRRSGSVVVISPDGQRHREVLSREDGLSDPSAIHYERMTNKLLVTNSKATAFLFDVTK